MYAQVDVAKKHFERNHKAASMAGHHNSHASGLQVVDQDLHELGSMSGASLPKSSPFSDVDLGSVHTAWEEHIWIRIEEILALWMLFYTPRSLCVIKFRL